MIAVGFEPENVQRESIPIFIKYNGFAMQQRA